MDDHDDIIRLLREERPRASELELDDIKRRVLQRAHTPRKGQPMRSRLAILLMVAFGMLLSGTGAGLAVQGFDQSSNDASLAQYPTPVPNGEGDVLGEEESSGPLQENNSNNNNNDDVQVAQQVESGDSLPFTGFAALPVLLAGVALVGAGLMLRRRSPTGD